MSDRVTSHEDSHFAEWLDTAQGVPLMRVVRQAGRHAPSARSGETTYVLAVPADLEALVARLIDTRVATREPPRTRGLVHFAGWKVDLIDRRMIAPGGGVARLPGLEFALLKVFVEQPRRTIARDTLARDEARKGFLQ